MVNQPDSTRDYIHDDSQSPISDTPYPDRARVNNRFRFDDLILTLANAHENRRARQVTEWESMRHPNFPAAV